MSSGFFALLDDIAAIAKVAAASLDDTASQASQVAAKAAGIVIDDTAVTPRYVTGFSADRELPIIAKIAWGSLKSKIIILLPAALALSWLAPWAITPVLMLGALYLCYEGYEKVQESFSGEQHVPDRTPVAGAADAKVLEDEKVAGAIRTDFILSAEIMALSLASVTSPDLLTRAAVLALVGLLVTAGVYGFVALLVKADDAGLFLAQNAKTKLVRSFGRGLVKAMPRVLALLGVVGIAAMLWVGGGIIFHGSEELGFAAPAHFVHDVAERAGGFFGPLADFVAWAVQAAVSGVFALVLGAIVALFAAPFSNKAHG